MQFANQNKLSNEGKIQLTTLKRYWQLFVRYWYVTAFTLALAVACYLYYAETVVQGALAQLQISLKYNEANKKNYSDYSDEMTGINSPELIQKTIESLRMDVSNFKNINGQYVELNDSLPYKITTVVTSPDLYEKYIKIKPLSSKIYEVTYPVSNSTITKTCYFDSAFTDTELKFIVEKNFKTDSLPDQYRNTEYFIQIHDKETLVGKYQSAIQTKLTKDLAVLQVMYRDILPNRAVQFLDTLARTYLNKTIKTQMERNTKMVSGIDKLLGGTENILRNIEDSLRNYSVASGLLSENIEQQKYLSEFTNVLDEKRRMEMQRMFLKDLERYMVDNKTAKGLPPAYIGEIDDLFLQNGLMELYKLEETRKDNLFDATEKSAPINKMDNSFENRRKDLLKYLQNAQVALNEKIEYLKKQMDDMDDPAKQGYKGYDKKQLTIRDLQRQLKINETMYMNLLEKRNNIMIAQASMAPEYKIFETAHIIEWNRPADRGMLLFYILLALTASFVFLYIKNLFFEEIDTMEYLKTKTVTPVLGEMPYIKFSGKNSTVSEVLTHPLGASLLGAIRTNLEFELAGKKSKVILITSHNSSEGKTFNAVNLGAILAKAKRKVLLLDMDFHKPNLANVLNLKSKAGGMEEIYNDTSAVSDAILNTDIENMDVIIPRTTIDDASEKIMSEITPQIIEWSRKNYDYVIIDTPPIGIISDALNLMKYADLSLYIINAVSPYKHSLTQVEEIIDRNHYKIQLILNKVRVKQLQYYTKHYYNYRYAKVS